MNDVLQKLFSGEWVDCVDVEKALDIDFSTCLKIFDFSRTAEWNPAPLNGQKTTTKFRIKNAAKGRWIFKQDKEFPCFGKAICSECRNVISISPDLLDVDYQRFFAGQKHYCYNCGAKMDGGNDNG